MRPGPRPRRPAARSRRWIATLVVAAATTAGCTAAPVEPTVPTVPFAPKLVLEVGDDALRWRPGPRADDTVSVDPARVREGTVVEIVNRASADRRVLGDDGKAFDTGVLGPGEATTLALTKQITGDETIAVRARGDRADATTTLVVVPRPDASG